MRTGILHVALTTALTDFVNRLLSVRTSAPMRQKWPVEEERVDGPSSPVKERRWDNINFRACRSGFLHLVLSAPSTFAGMSPPDTDVTSCRRNYHYGKWARQAWKRKLHARRKPHPDCPGVPQLDITYAPNLARQGAKASAIKPVDSSRNVPGSGTVRVAIRGRHSPSESWCRPAAA